MSNYKDEQKKTRAKLKEASLLPGYRFNTYPNRAKRRAIKWDAYATDNNVQTWVASEHKTLRELAHHDS